MTLAASRAVELASFTTDSRHFQYTDANWETSNTPTPTIFYTKVRLSFENNRFDFEAVRVAEFQQTPTQSSICFLNSVAEFRSFQLDHPNSPALVATLTTLDHICLPFCCYTTALACPTLFSLSLIADNCCRTWTEGKVLIFDDSFEHEVWQEAESFRLILIVDIWHPELTEQEKKTLTSI